jgi:hypothetical protein
MQQSALLHLQQCRALFPAASISVAKRLVSRPSAFLDFQFLFSTQWHPKSPDGPFSPTKTPFIASSRFCITHLKFQEFYSKHKQTFKESFSVKFTCFVFSFLQRTFKTVDPVYQFVLFNSSVVTDAFFLTAHLVSQNPKSKVGISFPFFFMKPCPVLLPNHFILHHFVYKTLEV